MKKKPSSPGNRAKSYGRNATIETLQLLSRKKLYAYSTAARSPTGYLLNSRCRR
jgi:hypothetical protein